MLLVCSGTQGLLLAAWQGPVMAAGVPCYVVWHSPDSIHAWCCCIWVSLFVLVHVDRVWLKVVTVSGGSMKIASTKQAALPSRLLR